MGGFGDGLIVIPARYDSCRLPGKPLMNIAGKTMIRRTYERAVLSGMSAIVVTNDDRIANECREHSIPIEMRNGYTFSDPSFESLRESIDRAFSDLDNVEKWSEMVRNGFNRDWSWKVPALEYLKIYRSH